MCNFKFKNIYPLCCYACSFEQQRTAVTFDLLIFVNKKFNANVV